MSSKSEEITTQCLRAVLAPIPIGATIGESPEFRDALMGLEYFLPTVLGEIHPEWIGEALDGFFASVAKKTGEAEVEILGICYLMSDQALAPVHLRLQLSDSADEISWLELRLGEKGRNGMVRIPHSSSSSLEKRLHSLDRKVNTMEWAYKVTFGERRVSGSRA